MGTWIFWSVLSGFYLVLAIVTCISGRHILRKTAKLKEPRDVITSRDGEVGLESTFHSALKAIIITDILGFLLAAIAAIISGLLDY